jgi:hypothetical protein
MFYLGLDLGKKHDHTAIVIVERWGDRLLLVRHLERVALGTPYTGVVARIREIVKCPGQWAVVVDGTGVGEPVVDALRRAGLAMGKVRMGADGYGEHDDLVIALALACWRARRRENGFGGGRLPGT